eukprot:jgi/Chrzof1/7245/Cz02g16100.t1
MPLHLQVSAVTPEAKHAVEQAGGTVVTTYYNQLGLRALLKPENFAAKDVLLPAPVRAAPPRDLGKFDIIGQIPPNKQLPVIRRLLTPVSGLMSPESQLAGV